MDNFRSLRGVRIIDRVPNAQIKEFCGVAKRVYEMIIESSLLVQPY